MASERKRMAAERLQEMVNWLPNRRMQNVFRGVFPQHSNTVLTASTQFFGNPFAVDVGRNNNKSNFQKFSNKDVLQSEPEYANLFATSVA